jgi:hypothetical protein
VPLWAVSPNFIGSGSNLISLHGDFAAQSAIAAFAQNTAAPIITGSFFISCCPFGFAFMPLGVNGLVVNGNARLADFCA